MVFQSYQRSFSRKSQEYLLAPPWEEKERHKKGTVEIKMLKLNPMTPIKNKNPIKSDHKCLKAIYLKNITMSHSKGQPSRGRKEC